jgi:NAD(P)H-dependent flavin oxidoreductase YrpB (nitropropane dioxygenase family)
MPSRRCRFLQPAVSPTAAVLRQRWRWGRKAFCSGFLASREAPLHANFKQAIVDSDGHDTVLTEIPDIAAGVVWPGAMSRAKRNRFIEHWAGREWALRQQRTEAYARVQAARQAGDVNNAPLSYGQDAGLINDVVPAGEIVQRIAREVQEILSKRLPAFIR